MNNLPIDLIPGTNPPVFQWKQTIGTPLGPRTVQYDGSLPPSVEGAVALLITHAKQQEVEIAELKEKLQGFAERIAGQSEVLSKHAEKHDAPLQHSPSRERGRKEKGGG